MTTTAAPLRRQTRFVPFRTPVRGHAFAARPPAAGAPTPGQRVVLAREPHNPADPLAVAVWMDAEGAPWRIGYLARDVAARLAPRMDDGVELEARVDGWVPEPERRWQRPVLAVFPVPDRFEPTAGVAADESGSRRRPAEPAPPHAAEDGGRFDVDQVLPSRPARSVRRRLSSARSSA